MYVSKYVNIPDDILNALQENKLVIFAGAGVSIPEPSLYPDFKELADKIGRGSLPRKANDPIDIYLGNLKRLGVDVHRRAKRMLSNSKSKPTTLHEDLVNLFTDPYNLRIVTTNFDKHFSTVITERFAGQVETYYAPALPLGGNFRGLVYLHGSVERNPETLVLTDGDFGQAYLTSAWATRFLYEMFANYTILFVGYSHEDPIIRYLSRGLALHQKTNRYALIKEDKSEFWKSFGIKPLGFHDYEELPIALGGLVKLINMGVLDNDDRIKKIVGSIPPMDPETLDYLDNVLNDPVRIKSFRRYAKSVEWLNWVAEKPQFRLLFIPGSQCSTLYELALWVADSFVVDHTDEILTIVQRHKQILHSTLWNCIAYRLWVDTTADVSIIKKWVVLLIRSYSPGCDKKYLEYLLEKYKNKDDCYIAILIFEFLTQPKLSLAMNYAPLFYEEENTPKPPKTIGEIEVLGDGYHLNEAWRKGIKNNMDKYARNLEAITTSNITKAYMLLTDFKDFNQYDEAVMAGHCSLGLQETDYHPEGMDVLVDAARDIIEWLIINRPTDGISVITKWRNSNIPILVRLSIYGISLARHMSPDEKTLWVIDNKVLFDHIAQTEVVSLLEKEYIQVSNQIKKKLIEKIVNQDLRIFYPWISDDKVLEQLRYNWLTTIFKWDTDYQYAKEQLNAMSEANAELRSGVLLDTKATRSKASWIAFQSPMTKDELLAKKPEDVIDFLIEFKEELFNGYSRAGLVASVAEAVASNYGWGIKLVKILFKREVWTSDLWAGIYRGWDKLKLLPNQWHEILSLTKCHKNPKHIANSVSDLLLAAIQKDTGGLPPECYICAEEIAKHILRAYIFDSEGNQDSEDWINEAINHPGGKLTQFVLNSLSKTRRSLENRNGLTEHYKEYFALLLNNDCYATQIGIVILATDVLFLFDTDKEWVLKNVLPLFKWKEENKKVQQAWNGFLHWGK
ncbi:hypothetical protein SDC9_59480 [bioreactor metagenome]|uniref:Uncharacterized protein n=1 Tax=bioreactor metagenome TaxID=1076179 RepID=A0A644XA92_9ZZZZ|nr:SIR2 family protein [Dysgonamonadaceae bacterium]